MNGRRARRALIAVVAVVVGGSVAINRTAGEERSREAESASATLRGFLEETPADDLLGYVIGVTGPDRLREDHPELRKLPITMLSYETSARGQPGIAIGIGVGSPSDRGCIVGTRFDGPPPVVTIKPGRC